MPSKEVTLTSLKSLTLSRLKFNSDEYDRLTHYLFRFPAKFHPPVARTLLKKYSQRGDVVLDPFCGSGTLLVEAAIVGRNAVGTDVDPLAVFVSSIKTHQFNIGSLRESVSRVLDQVESFRRPDEEYERYQFEDIDEHTLCSRIERENLWVPQIPNLYHWFRRYVILDLARILQQIHKSRIPEADRQFLRLCFAAIIRNASNADPVPVSGLEVTAHMREKEAQGRIVNPSELFEQSVRSNLDGVEEYLENHDERTYVRALRVNALRLRDVFDSGFDVVITSPPYHNAVNYYRRHQLEMFWLRFTLNQAERIRIKHEYIGRRRVLVDDPFIADSIALTPCAQSWHQKMLARSTKRANAFKSYMVSMSNVLVQLRGLVETGSKVVFVVGNSSWRGQEIPTADLFLELATSNGFGIAEVKSYPIKNRYMSYTRHNNASIDEEYVLVLECL